MSDGTVGSFWWNCTKEGYDANMDDEDWNIDLPLCSSTKMNQLFHSDIPVKQHNLPFGKNDI